MLNRSGITLKILYFKKCFQSEFFCCSLLSFILSESIFLNFLQIVLLYLKGFVYLFSELYLIYLQVLTHLQKLALSNNFNDLFSIFAFFKILLFTALQVQSVSHTVVSNFLLKKHHLAIIFLLFLF
jgi:hypothetical protein